MVHSGGPPASLWSGLFVGKKEGRCRGAPSFLFLKHCRLCQFKLRRPLSASQPCLHERVRNGTTQLWWIREQALHLGPCHGQKTYCTEVNAKVRVGCPRIHHRRVVEETLKRALKSLIGGPTTSVPSPGPFIRIGYALHIKKLLPQPTVWVCDRVKLHSCDTTRKT